MLDLQMLNLQTPNPWLGISLVMAILGSLMVGLRFYQHRFSPHPELVRKLLHVPMGLIALTFPWLFHSALPVVLLAGLAVAWLLALRFYQPLKQQLGSVLGGVERRSLGEIYFPLAVSLLFLFSEGDPLLYCIPMLILTLADAIAAIIGIRYGKHPYTTTDGKKSAEGSFAFFTVAFLSAHIPLLLLTNTGRAETLLISLTLGLLAMLIEAIAWQGLDNLFIPLGGFILLKTYLEMDVAALAARLGITIVLVIFTLSWRHRTTLNDSAILGAAFVGYVSWALGGWYWLLAPSIVFICYPLLTRQSQWEPPLSSGQVSGGQVSESYDQEYLQRVHNIYAVLSVASASVVWLFLASTFNRPELLYPYTLAFAANLAIIGIAGISTVDYWKLPNILLVCTFIFKGWLMLFVPLLLLQGITQASIVCGLTAFWGTALPAIAYYVTQPTLRKCSTDTLNWFCRAGYAAVGSTLSLIPLYLI